MTFDVFVRAAALGILGGMILVCYAFARHGVTRVWLMRAKHRRYVFIGAAAPCWKGEIQIGRAVIGWQRGEAPR